MEYLFEGKSHENIKWKEWRRRLSMKWNEMCVWIWYVIFSSSRFIVSTGECASVKSETRALNFWYYGVYNETEMTLVMRSVEHEALITKKTEKPSGKSGWKLDCKCLFWYPNAYCISKNRIDVAEGEEKWMFNTGIKTELMGGKKNCTILSSVCSKWDKCETKADYVQNLDKWLTMAC